MTQKQKGTFLKEAIPVNFNLTDRIVTRCKEWAKQMNTTGVPKSTIRALAQHEAEAVLEELSDWITGNCGEHAESE